MDSLWVARLCPLPWVPHLPEGQQLWVIDYILGILVVATLEPRVLQALFFPPSQRCVCVSAPDFGFQREGNIHSCSMHRLAFWLTPAPSLGSPFRQQMTLYPHIGVKAEYSQWTLPLALWILMFAHTMLCSSPAGSPGSWTWQWPQLRITWSHHPHTITHCVVKPGCSVKDIDQTHFPKPVMGL